jgi:L-alanine-DL-glutamate epimerase-like enolase superfamily enzyme
VARRLVSLSTIYLVVRTLRETIGPENKIRVDLARLDEFNIDFIEQPVVEDPVASMQEVRSRGTVAVSAIEGLWTVEDAFSQMVARTADVYCFSPYFTESLAQFQRLSWVPYCQACKYAATRAES